MVNERDPIKTAKLCLKKDLITHIGAFLTVAVCFFAFAYFIDGVTSAVYNLITRNMIVYELIYHIFVVFYVIMIFPLIYGLFVFEFNCSKGSKPDIRDLFFAFSSFRVYLRSWVLLFELLWRGALYFALPGVCTYLFTKYAAGSLNYIKPLSVFGYDFTYTLFCVAIAALYIISFIMFSKCFTAVYIAIERKDMPIDECFFAARVYNFRPSPSYTRVLRKLIPLFVLTPFTFGVSLIYTLPYSILVCFCTAKDICDNEAYLSTKLAIISQKDFFEGLYDDIPDELIFDDDDFKDDKQYNN